MLAAAFIVLPRWCLDQRLRHKLAARVVSQRSIGTIRIGLLTHLNVRPQAEGGKAV